MEGTIQIQGKEYKYSFKHKSRRIFMQEHGLEYWDEFSAMLEHLQPHPEKGMSVKGLDVFSSLVLSGIKGENPKFNDFTADDLVDHLIQEPDLLEKLMAEFAASMEQPRDPKPKPAKGKKRVPSSSGKKSKGAAA
jgi:hypothetical protein